MRSALYTGWVRHRRHAPTAHTFRYRLFMVYLDLAELEQVFSLHPLWRLEGPAAVSFRRADYLGDQERPLAEEVRDRVAAALGRRPGGAVCLLSHLRTWGVCFNPVSFYYCFDADDRLDAVVAEVTNTPWHERHGYVLDARTGRRGRAYRFSTAKALHVSPFFPMDQRYDWQLRKPAASLVVHMNNLQRGDRVFDATLALRRRELDPRAMTAVLVQYPLMTVRVIAAIHWQALRLWLKRVPFHSHPAKLAASRQEGRP